MIAANASSNEAEIIMEKQLREIAETSLDDTQRQLADAQSCIKEMREGDRFKIITGSKHEIEGNHLKVNNLKQKIKRLSVDIIALKESNQELKLQLKQFELEEKVTVEKLTERCRLSEIKVRKIEREENFEIAVTTEISNIRSESSTLPFCKTLTGRYNPITIISESFIFSKTLILLTLCSILSLFYRYRKQMTLM